MSIARITLPQLRRYAVARSLFAPTTLPAAILRLGFLQADPIRAPARAQDLILRHRVAAYRASDLERYYPSLDIEEDYFVNYGFMPRAHAALLHPRDTADARAATRTRAAAALLAAIQTHGELHPREAAAHDRTGRIANYWGGQSRTTTHLLDRLHRGGVLRVARRDNGIRVYAPARHAPSSDDPARRQGRADALVALVVALYAPLPQSSLAGLVTMLRRAAPRLRRELTRAAEAATTHFPHAMLAGTRWYWPPGEDPAMQPEDPPERVHFLAPFDPVVWDRRRFEEFWGWAYRFEAYVPPRKRRLGYYALPLLWRDRVIGWANLSVDGGVVNPDVGFVARAPIQNKVFRRELDAEVGRVENFLRCNA